MISHPEELPDEDAPTESSPGEPLPDTESKSQRKRNAHQITAFAAHLVEMKPKALAALPIEASIRDAIRQCAEIRAHGARKRQLHFVSKLLRESENIQELQMLVMHPELVQKTKATANPHLAFRDQLLENFADMVEPLRETYPTVELQQVRQLVRNAHSEFGKIESKKEPSTEQTNSETDNQQTVPSPTIGSTRAAKSLLKLLTTASG